MRQKQAVIEAILFSMGESVSKKQLMAALDIPEDLFFYLIDQLKRKYNRKDSGIRLLELDGSYQLCTRPEYYDQLIKIVNQPKKPKLTDVMMETLSIIAYKQPVTKQEIEAIRVQLNPGGRAFRRRRTTDIIQNDGRILALFWSGIHKRAS